VTGSHAERIPRGLGTSIANSGLSILDLKCPSVLESPDKLILLEESSELSSS
jgi:hypothetical protein